ncbi:hypothetical protein OSB04_009843 [Centaurea solstitialis]|uniref:No apical meristem-associated C-terminal domain-containing protein n=1 Tax=Centaurea solstitialis TaxID=347529 RepID=A0AA38WMI7_9ASTR|nr:hypothetical protein OSB04_009843 [Centaurea solstitialis]
MNPNTSVRGRGSRGAGGSRGGSRGRGSRGGGGSGGAGPSGGAGGSGFGGGSAFVDYANHEPYIPQFDAQQQPPFIPHFDTQNAGYGTGYAPNFFPYPPNYFPTQFSNTAFPTHYGTSGVNTDYSRGNTAYPDFIPRDTASGSDSSETHSYVPETQRLPTEGSVSPDAEPELFPEKPKQTFPTRATAKKWTPDEEVALCQAWINESENPSSGNAQRSIQFWRSIERSFYARLQVAPYRTHHQLTAKWKAMNKKIMAFNGIYNQIMNNKPSGESGVNLLKKVRSQYQMTEGVRHIPKWAAIPLTSGRSSSRSTKRTRTSGSSDGHFGQDSDEVEVPPPKRPVGRGKAKKALRGGQSSTPTTELYESWDRNLAEKMDYKMKKLELDRKIAELEEKKLQLQLNAEYEQDWLFCKTPHDHLSGLELEAVLQKKAVLRARHDFKF